MINQAFLNSHFCKKISKVLEMSVKLKFQYERFEKKQCFVLMVLNWDHICFC